jgi:hypothetical protein
MYCLLCHAKIPRLRAWRTKSEFCCDEHAEAYKNQMLDRLMVNEGEGAEKKAEKKTAPAGETAADRAKAETPAAATKEEPEVSAAPRKQRGGQLLGRGISSSPASAPPHDELASERAAGAKEQTAEQALAALRELAENAAQRSKAKQQRAEPPVAETPAGDPLGEMTLAGTSAPAASEDVFDELRELAGRALPLGADLESDEADAGQGTDDLDMVTRSSALERLMQEAVSAEQSGSSSEETASLEIDELLRRDAAHQAETVTAAPREEEEIDELLAEKPGAASELPEVSAETAKEEQAIAAAEPEAEEAAEVVEAAPEEASQETSVEPMGKAAGPVRGNVVPFPSAGAEQADEPVEEAPEAARAESQPSAGRAPDQDVKAARSSESKKAAGHPLLRAKMQLEPLLDLFSTGHEEPAVEESQAGWDEFVRQVRGPQASLKEMNGVIQTQLLPSYPPGPRPALPVSDMASDFALFDTLPATEDGPRLEMQPAEAEIADFEAACVHPELVFLNFSLSTTKASGLVDMAEWISRSAPLPANEAQITMRPAAGQVAEPSFAPTIPSGFLLRCGDLSLSEDPGFLAGELLMMGTLPTDISGAERPEAARGTAFSAEFRKFNQPSMGTEFPDRLFGGVEGTSSSSERLTAGDLADAEPASRDLPPGTFPPIEGAGKGPGGKGGSRGVFEPVFETKRPLDRDLSDYV